MRKPIAMLFAAAFLLAANPRQDQALPSQLSIKKQENAADKQSPELDEADQLSRQVIELYKAGEFDKALPLAQRVIALREKMLGSDHILVAAASANLAELYMAKAKTNEAKVYLQRAIAILDKNPGVGNTMIINVLERYACLLSDTGQKGEMPEVRKRLFKLNNGIEYDESLYKATHLPYPQYPSEARSKRVTGTVVAKITVDEAGKVVTVKALCGNPLLVKGIGHAAWNARFKPPMAAGHPIRFIDIITYTFTAN
jgi:TonB family protein